MLQIPSKNLTIEEFLLLPETKASNEYIEGRIAQKSMLKGKHSTTQIESSSCINQIFKPQQIA